MNVAAMIAGIRAQQPDLYGIILEPELHEKLCDELTTRDGRPSRVYCYAGLNIEIDAHV